MGIESISRIVQYLQELCITKSYIILVIFIHLLALNFRHVPFAVQICGKIIHDFRNPAFRQTRYSSAKTAIMIDGTCTEKAKNNKSSLQQTKQHSSPILIHTQAIYLLLVTLTHSDWYHIILCNAAKTPAAHTPELLCNSTLWKGQAINTVFL